MMAPDRYAPVGAPTGVPARAPALPRPSGGFTLLELLVGLVVLGFILAGLAQGTRYGLRAADSQARFIAGRSELDAVDRTLRRLVAATDPGSAHGGPTFKGTAAELAFVSDLPAAVTGYVQQEASLGLGVDSNRRLVLRWTPYIPAPRLAPAPPPKEAELLRGVDHIELSYWNNGWRSTWTEPALPLLVRLRIVFSSTDPRHWPDLIIAPLRHRAA